MSQPENAWAIAEELMSQNMLDVPIHVAAPVIAKVLTSRAPATTPTDQILTPSGAFTQAVREKVLMPSPCGVAGHFEFQLNGGSCMMCQREQRLVSEALKLAQAAAPGGKEPSEYDQCHSNSLFCEKCGICHTEKFPCPRASHPLQDKPPCGAVCMAWADCGDKEVTLECLLSAEHEGPHKFSSTPQDKPTP